MDLKTPKEKVIKPVNPPKKYERQFSAFCVGMVESMAKQFKNETLLSLNQSTIKKFADAKQVGNYGAIFLSMSEAATKSVLGRFTDIKLKKYIIKLLNDVNKFNQESIYVSVGESIGIDPMLLMQQEALSPDFNALMAETVMWAQKLRDDTLSRFVANSLRMMTQGATMEDILKEYEADTKKSKDRAKFMARNQIASFNNLSSKLRHQNLGISEGIWRTCHDERVRSAHNNRRGQRFDLSTGCYSKEDGKTIFPGTEHNCRCTYSAVIPGDDE